jgi:glycine C-acetyltransferase
MGGHSSDAGHLAAIAGKLQSTASPALRATAAIVCAMEARTPRPRGQAFAATAHATLQDIRAQGLYKTERVLATPQGAAVGLPGGSGLLNFCANNYLGLANHAAVVAAAQRALAEFGYGMASVRFICGTHQVHRTLEQRLAAFLGFDDTILYSSCFDANGGLFETLLSEQDAVLSDALNHASIIDGIRLCKAQKFRYANADLADLEGKLKESQGARTRLIVTDGVFSMDGSFAPLAGICDLADRYDALVCVDDSHATGFVGDTGRGTPERAGVMGRVDLLTSTLGKALGGAAGGFVAGSAEAVAWLRQRSRPYLFSNSIPPVVAATSLAVLDLVERGDPLRGQLRDNALRFRSGLQATGFTLLPGEHPIIPVMLYDAALAARMAERLLALGVYVVGFSFPVVPKCQARIRTQMSAAHTPEQVDFAIQAFTTAGRELGVIR